MANPHHLQLTLTTGKFLACSQLQYEATLNILQSFFIALDKESFIWTR